MEVSLPQTMLQKLLDLLKSQVTPNVIPTLAEGWFFGLVQINVVSTLFQCFRQNQT